MISFVVSAIPVAQPRQRHRIMQSGGKSFAHNFTPTDHPVNAFKASVRAAAKEAYQGAPLDGPVGMLAIFVMPRPCSMIWKTREMPRIHHAKKPDVDNLLKSLKDALSGLAWRDDSQVCFVESSKWIAAGDEQPHTIVQIRSLQY